MSWSRIPRSSKLLCLLALLYAGPSWAIEGGPCSGFIPAKIGEYRSDCTLLCDGNKSAASTCAEMLLYDGINVGLGYPRFFTVAIELESGCSGTPDIIPRGKSKTGGATHDLVRTSLSTSDDSGQTFTISYPIIDAAISDVAGCTDLEVWVIMWYSR